MSLITLETLVDEIRTRAAERERFLVAIAGPPGSGKSTIAAELAGRLGSGCAVLPMDGFHLDNDRLRQMGLLHRKGAPETFDAAGFVRLIRRLRTQGTVSYPTFDRAADKTLPDTGHIDAATRIVLAEGNYLLLNTPPWSELDGLFDLTVSLDVPRAELETRLITRWLDHGLSADEARARAMGNDMKNADFIFDNSRAADVTLQAGAARLG